jgi:cell fate (sporulation/competence/biofilm development) regulator YlbF (YheA/YmcA/DUF963 family)
MMTTENTTVLQKTRELCQAITEQPEFKLLRQQIETFMGNEEAKAQYQHVVEKSEVLQQKQQTGEALTQEEIQDFETHREALVNNPVGRGFLDAQQQMHQVQESVNKYVTKTFEIGRLPNPEDIASCGSGCSCH